jgi:hypothetical protein
MVSTTTVPQGAARVPVLGTVTSLVLVVSSSRSGSSLLLDLLQRHCQAAYLRGECAPFMRLSGLAYPDSAMASDELLASHASPNRIRALGESIARECGWPLPTLSAEQLASFSEDLWWRLSVQWPEADFNRDLVRRSLERALRQMDWSSGDRLDLPAFYIADACTSNLLRASRSSAVRH